MSSLLIRLLWLPPAAAAIDLDDDLGDLLDEVGRGDGDRRIAA